MIEGEVLLLKIFLGESDKAGSIPVYEKIVIEAKDKGLAGSTVYKGIMGFGRTSRIHTTKILRLSEDLPIIIEIVDEVKKIEKFIPLVVDIFEQYDCGGLISTEKTEIIKYKSTKNKI